MVVICDLDSPRDDGVNSEKDKQGFGVEFHRCHLVGSVLVSGLAVRDFLSGVIRNCMIARSDTNIAGNCSLERQILTSHGGDINRVYQDWGKYPGECDDGQHDLGQVDTPLHDAEVTGQELRAK